MARYTKRGKVWQYEISYKTKDGKYKKLRKSAFPKKSDAILAASEMEIKLGKGFAINDKDILLSDYFRQWIKIYKKGKISDVTFLKYENILMNIEKYFKYATVKSLTRTRYQEVINQFSKTHATPTIERFNSTIRASIVNLIDEGVIPLDFTKNVVIKGETEVKKEKDKYLNFLEFKRLMKSAKSRINPKYPSNFMIFIAGMTGMRFGELLGLTWDNINYDKKYINVCQTWDYHLNTGFAPTKNDQSVRKISIDDSTLEALSNFQAEQTKFFRSLEMTNRHHLVFSNAVTQAISNNAINKQLSKLCKQSGIDTPLTLHGLRHTHASVLLYKDVNILAVSKRLGHKDLSITMSVYSHILKELEEKENKHIASILEEI